MAVIMVLRFTCSTRIRSRQLRSYEDSARLAGRGSGRGFGGRRPGGQGGQRPQGGQQDGQRQ